MIIIPIIETTEAEKNNHVPKQGEVLICTDSEKLYVGNGVEVGGLPTTKKATRMSKNFDDMNLNETLESHYVITSPEAQQGGSDDDDVGNMFLVTDEVTNNPLYGASELPDPADFEVGDVVFIY